MFFSTVWLFSLAFFPVTVVTEDGYLLHFEPNDVTVTIGEHADVLLSSDGDLSADVQLTLNQDPSFDGTPHTVLMNASQRTALVKVTGIQIKSSTILQVVECHYVGSAECPFRNLNHTFATIHVVHSKALSIAVIIVGWTYFVAWSISFYPQIYLNFKRSSVIGLNFDFLLLNIIGFSCYTVYNVLMFFDSNIQEIYEQANPHRLIPVLINDVVFAAHALFACIITAIQCFIYERGNQRVSYVCWGISSVLIGFAGVSLLLTASRVINALQFITFLSYIKMVVTVCKYFPQAYFNYRRKSTVGWSIGNVLLDFLGGIMGIIQMILQALNSDDWSAFSGNPVKFGLGMVSMFFDVLFMIQHYVLYRERGEQAASYEGVRVQPNESEDRTMTGNTSAEYTSSAPIVNSSERIVYA